MCTTAEGLNFDVSLASEMCKANEGRPSIIRKEEDLRQEFTILSRAAFDAKKADMGGILKGSGLTAKQEAALLADCTTDSRGPTPSDLPVNKIREESMLAGLGVIAPDEIGIASGTTCAL